MDLNIELICGESEQVFNPEEISNDPNFVFTNDPSFDTLRLYDPEGNVINVNSWLECANYVSGGWRNEIIDLINGERILFITTIGIFLGYIFITRYLNSKRKV
tara:strand:+ start:286 stop:594 length:309 start_codon:yes stop_codon:yes gene_type:complete